ncbi:thiol reductant ABC exporter subunit CydD [Brachybacterium huguangmaarense]
MRRSTRADPSGGAGIHRPRRLSPTEAITLTGIPAADTDTAREPSAPGRAASEGRRARPPLDPRLLREVRAARRHVGVQAVLGLVQTACVIVTALALGRLGADLLTDGITPSDRPAPLLAALAALFVRALAVLVQQRTAHRAATEAVADLRVRLVRHAALRGPRGSAGRGADLASLTTTGLEALRPYLVGYVPQLVLAAILTPLCFAAIAWLDLTSALLAAVAIPLIPIFMILIGRLTEGRSEALLLDMRVLWSQLLDLVEGLPTLRALGRERGPEATVEVLGMRHRASALGSLRYAFLSSMVLELLATLGVALVAVSIGLRLVSGDMDLAAGIAVLVLAPELYLPLRQVGQQFHASTDGLAAVDATFAVLDEPLLPDGDIEAPDLRTARLELEGVSVRSRHGLAPAGASLVLEPGRVLALAGPSGSGKTTSVQVLLGLLAPDEGHAVVRAPGAVGIDVLDLRRASLWDQVAHLPQRPVVGPGTVRSVLGEARPGATDDELEAAARAAGLLGVVAERGWDAPVGRGGVGLSLGERQRLALARAALSPAPLVVLDEPTAHLDGASERIVLDLVAAWRAQGRTVLLIAHRGALLDAADEIVELRPAVDAAVDVDADEEVPA